MLKSMYWHILCIFWHANAYEMHILVLQVPWMGKFKFPAVPIPLGFRFSMYQHIIACKHTHLPGSCYHLASPGWVALGWMVMTLSVFLSFSMFWNISDRLSCPHVIVALCYHASLDREHGKLLANCLFATLCHC